MLLGTSVIILLISFQFKKVNQFVNILSSGKVHKILGQSVAQVGTGLDGDFAVCTTEHWIILWKRQGGKTRTVDLNKARNVSGTPP